MLISKNNNVKNKKISLICKNLQEKNKFSGKNFADIRFKTQVAFMETTLLSQGQKKSCVYRGFAFMGVAFIEGFYN